MSSDHHIVKSDALADALNLCPKLTVVTGRAVGKGEHVQPCTELLDNIKVFVRACGLFGAIDELSYSVFR
jgi:hypothetical protein